MESDIGVSISSIGRPVPLTSQAKKIVVFGEVLADIFPERTVLGGAPYNVARHLRGFAQYPTLITRVGSDALKDTFLQEMDLWDMDASGIQIDPVYPTGKVVVHMHAQGHRFEIEANQAYDHIDEKAVHLAMLTAKPEMAYFGTLVQRSAESQSAMASFLDAAICAKFLDMNLRPPWVDSSSIKRSLLAADILKLNDEELTTVAAMFNCKHRDQPAQAAFLMEKFNLDLLLVTCGASGAWALLSDGEIKSTVGNPIGIALVDTVGAGDGFSAVCMVGLLNHWPVDTLLTRANRFASAICRIRGAVPSEPNFYKAFLEDWN